MGNKISINPWLEENYPDSYNSMGLTAERVAARYGISREDADEFALREPPEGPRGAVGGQVRRRDCPRPGRLRRRLTHSRRPRHHEVDLRRRRRPPLRYIVRSAREAEACLPRERTVTAGNSSQMSDGAAAAVVMSAERAQALGIRPLARFVAFAYAGCLPEEMGIGPVYAIPKALKLAG